MSEVGCNKISINLMPKREDIDSRFFYKVYIIESPSKSDIVNSINEGDSLSSTLKLCGINNLYLTCDSKISLKESLLEVSKDINQRHHKRIPIPYLHFSIHGCETGIGLSNGELIEWDELRAYLMELNLSVRFARSGSELVSRFSLSMSACMGVHAYKMYYSQELLNPFWSLVGPTSEIDWGDSLVAFVVFYHSLIYKRSRILEAVDKMNMATGLDVFRNFLDNRFVHI